MNDTLPIYLPPPPPPSPAAWSTWGSAPSPFDGEWSHLPPPPPLRSSSRRGVSTSAALGISAVLCLGVLAVPVLGLLLLLSFGCGCT